MKLTFKKREVKDLRELQRLVAENLEALEPGLRLIDKDVNLGQVRVPLAALDTRLRPVLIEVALVADDTALYRMLEAYAWAVEYPDSLRQLVAGTGGGAEWPPRVVFVAERLLEAFLRKLRLIRFPRVECFEYRYVEVNGTSGFFTDLVDWTVPAPTVAAAEATAAPPAAPPEPTAAPGAPEPAQGPERVGEPRPRVRIARESAPRAESARPATSAPGVAATQLPRSEAGRAPDERAPARPVDAGEPVRTRAGEVTPGAAPAEGQEQPRSRQVAPTWRKFLDRLSTSFETPEPPTSDAVPEVAAPPATQPPRPAPNGSPADEPAVPASSGEPPRPLLAGLQLPPGGELAPQWRRFLEHAPLDDTKIAAVREYLRQEFPLHTVYDFHDYQRGGQVYQVQDSHGKVTNVLTVAHEFFEARRDQEIHPWLDKHRLAHSMRQAGQTGVLVTPGGVQLEKR